jgi:hypothetical protein
VIGGSPVVQQLGLRLVQGHCARADVADHFGFDAALAAVLCARKQLQIVQGAWMAAKPDSQAVIKRPFTDFIARDGGLIHQSELDGVGVAGGWSNRSRVAGPTDRALERVGRNVRVQGGGAR